MYASKVITLAQAVEAVLELAELNYIVPKSFRELWAGHEVQDTQTHAWYPDPFNAVVEGCEGLNRAHLLGLKSPQETFDTGFFGGPEDYGFTYAGQFTPGRFIAVGYRVSREDPLKTRLSLSGAGHFGSDFWSARYGGTPGSEYYIEAETGTESPSAYFREFDCIEEHLPKLTRAWPETAEVSA